MLKEVIDGFKRWATHDEYYSILKSTSKVCDRICADVESIDSRVKQLESAEKSRAEAMDFISSSTESIKTVCDDCVYMRLELDAIKHNIEVMSARIDSIGNVEKPKRVGRRNGDAKITT